VLDATGLHCSIGIGDTKVRAKIATEFGKPRGVYRLTRDNWMEVMGDRPTTALWGVGNRIAARLADLGIRTVRELAESPDEPLVAAFGPNTGPHFGRLGRGAGSASSTTPRGSPAPTAARRRTSATSPRPRRSPRACARWPTRSWRTSGARAVRVRASTSRCGSRRSSP
jgi:nucleotidyltransferase/DNA polymerase involved in DNA repair